MRLVPEAVAEQSEPVPPGLEFRERPARIRIEPWYVPHEHEPGQLVYELAVRAVVPDLRQRSLDPSPRRARSASGRQVPGGPPAPQPVIFRDAGRLRDLDRLLAGASALVIEQRVEQIEDDRFGHHGRLRSSSHFTSSSNPSILRSASKSRSS